MSVVLLGVDWNRCDLAEGSSKVQTPSCVQHCTRIFPIFLDKSQIGDMYLKAMSPEGESSVREAPLKKLSSLVGHCLLVWGTYSEKNCPSSNGHLLDCGGVKMLARMVWGTYAVKIEVQMGICFC